ncbi:MAG TPA: chorismate synthase [Phycisphaerae bacterium]|nr:chorismate synthase [Phycisphaerae bacterium]HRY66883.1 chorismate synthase [Phycisphaerae bacterium]
MLGCDLGTMFRTTVAGGSYQEGLTIHLQGVPPGLLVTEEQIYEDLLIRKPGQGDLTSPRREPDIPIIYNGVNAADTMPGFTNAGYTNGTPMVILIPNLDRHFEHIEQYQSTNRTPRPGHASYASYMKYDQWDDAIGAGIFSGRYTSTIVAAGVVAKRVLADHGIEVTGYVKEAAGVVGPDMPIEEIRARAEAYRRVRKVHDPIWNYVYKASRIKPGMRLLEKLAVLKEVEDLIERFAQIPMNEDEVRAEYGVHPQLFCPDLAAADEMFDRIVTIKKAGDSSGGVVEVQATGLPAGMGEPVFKKLDGELGRMLSIGAVKAVEIGAGVQVKDMTGSQCNDQLFARDGKVYFGSNNAGGLTGGLTTGQTLVVRLTVKPTPTISRDQHTIDKVSREETVLKAVTRRDPTLVARIWPVAEAFTALVLLDHLMMHLGYQALWRK